MAPTTTPPSIVQLQAPVKRAAAIFGPWTRANTSWYGPRFHGRKTASGRVYDQHKPTVAHRTLPLGSLVQLRANGRMLLAVVTDRGPFVAGRDIDVSRYIKDQLGLDDLDHLEMRRINL